MEKVIVILTGQSEGKTKFINHIKEKGWWTWNINHMNRLSDITRDFGWNGERDPNYYDFVKKLDALVNEYWDFKYQYIENLINKFQKSDKTYVLIVHSADFDVAKILTNKYSNCYTIHITDSDEVNPDYSKTLNCKDDNYLDNIVATMETLTKDIKDLKEKEDGAIIVREGD
jgi:hypothetical protein